MSSSHFSRRILGMLHALCTPIVVIDLPPAERADFVRMMGEVTSGRLMAGEALGELPPPVGFDIFRPVAGEPTKPRAEQMADALGEFAAETMLSLLHLDGQMSALLKDPIRADDAVALAAVVEGLERICAALGRGLTVVACNADQARKQLQAFTDAAATESAETPPAPLSAAGPGETATGRPPLGAFGAASG
jgi:hypothetical protein